MLVDDNNYEAIKSNSVGENEMLFSNYQQALKKEKEEIITSKSKALRKKRSAREMEVDDKIS